MRNHIIKDYSIFDKTSSIELEYSIKGLGSLLKLIPAFSLLSINNLYLGSSKSSPYK